MIDRRFSHLLSNLSVCLAWDWCIVFLQCRRNDGSNRFSASAGNVSIAVSLPCRSCYSTFPLAVMLFLFLTFSRAYATSRVQVWWRRRSVILPSDSQQCLAFNPIFGYLPPFSVNWNSNIVSFLLSCNLLDLWYLSHAGYIKKLYCRFDTARAACPQLQTTPACHPLPVDPEVCPPLVPWTEASAGMNDWDLACTQLLRNWVHIIL